MKPQRLEVVQVAVADVAARLVASQISRASPVSRYFSAVLTTPPRVGGPERAVALGENAFGALQVVADETDLASVDGEAVERMGHRCVRHYAQGAGFASIKMAARRHGRSLLLTQAWLVPRWTTQSPAFSRTSPSSITIHISPEMTTR